MPVEITDAMMRAKFTVGARADVGFCLTWAPAEAVPPEGCTPDRVRERRF